ncbi:MAG TPA: MGMT family protein [Candidatus Limnocylindrales bacterium]|nr:MGMT family protein [Candidatus Limnocylindrales bacterium]
MLQAIRKVILQVPRGKVSTYGAVARAAGFPGAARQVVWALRGGHGLPWHRVLAAGGRIALPGEHGFEQRMRLEAEGVLFSGSRVRMSECEHKFGPARSKRAKSRAISPKAKSATRKNLVRKKRRR